MHDDDDHLLSEGDGLPEISFAEAAAIARKKGIPFPSTSDLIDLVRSVPVAQILTELRSRQVPFDEEGAEGFVQRAHDALCFTLGAWLAMAISGHYPDRELEIAPRIDGVELAAWVHCMLQIELDEARGHIRTDDRRLSPKLDVERDGDRIVVNAEQDCFEITVRRLHQP